MIGLFLMATEVIHNNVLLVTPVYSLESNTAPAAIIDCDIVRRRGTWTKVRFKRTGGRAYQLDSRLDFSKTPYKWEVLEDKSGLFAGMTFRNQYTNNEEVNFSRGDEFWATLYDIRGGSNPELMKVIRIEFLKKINGYPAGAYQVTGFCDVNMSAQTPLAQGAISQTDLEKLQK
jgi:hypothetical protein